MKRSIRARLTKIINEMINPHGHAEDKETIQVLKTNSGREFNVVTVNGKILYVVDKQVNLDTHDKHFIKQVMSMFTDCHRVVVTGSGNGSKFFKAKSKGKLYQFRRGKADDEGISVFVDNQKIENPLRKDQRFINFADVIRYLTTNHK